MDPRDKQAAFGSGDWPSESAFDERAMSMFVEECDGMPEHAVTAHEKHGRGLVFECTYKVCELCDGKGSHVNPSIDACGITESEFADYPGFHEEYVSGAYDVPCFACKGKRVVPDLVNGGCHNDTSAVEWLKKWRESEARDRREREAELKYGW